MPTAVVWLPTAYAVGVVGRRVRQGSSYAQTCFDKLVSLSERPRVGHLDVIYRYLPAVGEQILAVNFYGSCRSRMGPSLVRSAT